MSEIHVSTGIESDGPIPGPHSMLSFGSAAFRADKSLVFTFNVRRTEKVCSGIIGNRAEPVMEKDQPPQPLDYATPGADAPPNQPQISARPTFASEVVMFCLIIWLIAMLVLAFALLWR